MNSLEDLMPAIIQIAGIFIIWKTFQTANMVRHAADKDYLVIVLSDCYTDADDEAHHVLTTKTFPRQKIYILWKNGVKFKI